MWTCASLMLLQPAGCSSETAAGDQICEPGGTQACSCTDGKSGAQSCAEDGQGWMDCVCADGGQTGSDATDAI
ncbi:MAG: hypothetical protein ACI9OJ_004981, partial [Myxococcota bacterium]